MAGASPDCVDGVVAGVDGVEREVVLQALEAAEQVLLHVETAQLCHLVEVFKSMQAVAFEPQSAHACVLADASLNLLPALEMEVELVVEGRS